MATVLSFLKKKRRNARLFVFIDTKRTPKKATSGRSRWTQKDCKWLCVLYKIMDYLLMLRPKYKEYIDE